MTWGVVMIEHPFFCNVCFHANAPFSEPFKDVFIKKNFVASVTDMLKTIPVEDNAASKSGNNVSIGVYLPKGTILKRITLMFEKIKTLVNK